jgi:D-amino-acid dehydrogenase
MKVAVLGAGVIGALTSYYLQEEGHEVVLIDRNNSPASECSFANGGQLSFSHAEPWASPTLKTDFLKLYFSEFSPFSFDSKNLIKYFPWLRQFFTNCNEETFTQNTKKILSLSLYSKKCLEIFQKDNDIEFNHTKDGTAHIFYDNKYLDKAIRMAKIKEEFGSKFSVLTKEQCIKKNHLLTNSNKEIVGGIFYPLDESGDTHLFTTKLIKSLKNKISLQFNTTIERIETNNNQISGIKTNNGLIQADAYVICLGSMSPYLSNKIGIKTPICPIKGHSISVSLDENDITKTLTPLTDSKHKIVISRLGNHLRIAGMAGMNGYNDNIYRDKMKILENYVQEILGKNKSSITSRWSCLRPSTPSNVPIIGQTKYKNLYLNTGHSSLGWTLSFGSGKLISDIISKNKCEIDIDNFTY